MGYFISQVYSRLKIADLQSELDIIYQESTQLEIDAAQAIFKKLFNLIERIARENETLESERQQLTNEINRLKGEQGKPDIKANKKQDGDISSEQERKQAEETDEDKADREGFKLNKSSLEKLKEQGLPVELLESLDSMKGNKYSNEAEFIKEMETLIGKELTDQHRTLLIKYARYKKRNRQPKVAKIIINREVKCPVDRNQIPVDAKFKGYESKVIQDVIIKTDNIEFKREHFYSPSEGKSYLGQVPEGYNQGDFGPHINADIISMKYVNGMSIPKIVEFYQNISVLISSSYISNQLIKPAIMDVFHQEKSQMHQAAIEVSPYLQIDDTGTRVNGQNHYTQIICNEWYTAFFTTEHKDRLTILGILRNFGSNSFLLNDDTLILLEQFKVSKTDRVLLSEHKRDKPYQESEMLDILHSIYDTNEKPRIQAKIMEGCAIMGYRQETSIDIVKILVCDDATQFKLLTDALALCWIHNGRHYKRLNPLILLHQEILADFLQQFWAYYQKLAAYKKNPGSEQAVILDAEFDTLFTTKTGYDDLDERIKKSKNKKEELLVVLKHPEVPLHNNVSENAARVEKRRRDVSLQTKTEEGTKAKDTMMSIVETCKKLGISAYKFIYDRVNGINDFPSLAEMLRAKAAG